MSPEEKKLKGKMRQEHGYRTFHVVAEDPDSDQMRYRFRLINTEKSSANVVGEKGWSEDPFWSVDTAQLPGGVYRVQADVDDALSNGLVGAKSDSEQQKRFGLATGHLTVIQSKTKKSAGQLRFVVRSDGAALSQASCRFVDGWLPIQPKDGIVDASEEIFEVSLGSA